MWNGVETVSSCLIVFSEVRAYVGNKGAGVIRLALDLAVQLNFDSHFLTDLDDCSFILSSNSCKPTA